MKTVRRLGNRDIFFFRKDQTQVPSELKYTFCQTMLPLLFVRFNKKIETISLFGSKVPKDPDKHWFLAPLAGVRLHSPLIHPLAAVFLYFFNKP